MPSHYYRMPDFSEHETGYNIAEALITLASAHRGETPFHPNFADGYRMHRLVDAIRQSVDTKGWVEVAS